MRSNARTLVSSGGSLLLGLTAACGLLACNGDDNGTPVPDGGSEDSGSTKSSSDAGASAPDATTPEDAGSTGDGSSAPADSSTPVDAGPSIAPAVYTMTNAATGNAIVGFARSADGSLTPMASAFPTGGNGSGAGLGEQGAVAYDYATNRVYAVNAGDNSFSFLPVNADGSLGTAVKVPASAGSLVGPKSVAVSGSTVYVLYEGNATTASAIAGYSVTGAAGTPIAGSVLLLSSATQSVDPAQISFSPDGKWLVVTEKQSGTGTPTVTGPGSIDTFAVDANGLATKQGFYPPAGLADDAGLQMKPFGFAFYGSYLVVSEAASTGVGSYTYAGGVIAPITGAAQFLPTDPAPCWVTFSGAWAYVANAMGPDVSGFTVSGTTGGLTNIGTAANAVVAPTGKTIVTDAGTTFQGPTDDATSEDGKFLYVVNAAVPSIGSFAVNADGTLTRVGSADYTAASLPGGIVGIVAR